MTFDKDLFNKTRDKYMELQNVSEEEATRKLMSLGPKGLHEAGVEIDQGWRAGYTKTSVRNRVTKNRKKEKARRKTNRRNRKMKGKK